MNKQTRDALMEAWNWCDMEDKSTEFMFAYMSDVAEVDYDTVVDFVCNTSFEERQEWRKENESEDE